MLSLSKHEMAGAISPFDGLRAAGEVGAGSAEKL
jgi:hypothetical protein